MKNICFMCMFDSCSYAIVLVSIKMETRFIISMLLQYSEKAASLMLEVIKTKKNDSFYFQYSLSLSLSLSTLLSLSISYSVLCLSISFSISMCYLIHRFIYNSLISFVLYLHGQLEQEFFKFKFKFIIKRES